MKYARFNCCCGQLGDLDVRPVCLHRGQHRPLPRQQVSYLHHNFFIDYKLTNNIGVSIVLFLVSRLVTFT